VFSFTILNTFPELSYDNEDKIEFFNDKFFTAMGVYTKISVLTSWSENYKW